MRGRQALLVAAASLASATFIPCTSTEVAGCGTGGYCDTSVGRCICAPGRKGADCSDKWLGHCRLHEAGEMACMTFIGLMSCSCRRACEQRHGGVARRHAPICWEWANDSQRPRGPAANLSDFPESIDAVEFYSPAWPPTGRCARPDPPRHCASSQHRSARRATNILGGTPLPNRRCPLSCSHRGTCIAPQAIRTETSIERFPLRGGAGASGSALDPTCICHAGYSGASCEVTDMGTCFNRCSGHGMCVGRFCLCDRGWRGLDCSIAQPQQPLPATAAAVVGPPTKYVPTYVYPLATHWSLEGVYQRDQLRRGQYYANLMFAAELHARQDSIVSDPEDAALFFVPVMVMQVTGTCIMWHGCVAWLTSPYTWWWWCQAGGTSRAHAQRVRVGVV